MNPFNPGEWEKLPQSLVEATAKLKAEVGNDLRFRGVTFVIKGARAMHIAPRYRSQMMRNPARENSFWGWLTASDYVRGQARDLSELFVDGVPMGKLHGGSEDMALGIAPMLANGGEINLIISGHYTESGWYIDSLSIAR